MFSDRLQACTCILGDSKIPKSLLVFISAFLLFVVQPMAGKEMLPRWGGSANVWTACLLFFQICLLIGYAYACISARWLSGKGQSIVHGALMLAASAWLIVPWPRGVDIGSPAFSVLASLCIALAIPTIALSSASPIASHWISISKGERETYRLYAASNAGSLLGCLAYPFGLEPWLSLGQQKGIYLAVFVFLCVAWLVACKESYTSAPGIGDSGRIGVVPKHGWMWSLWLVLSFSTAVILASSTHGLSQAGIVVPGLWVAPLAIYLATWWVAFRGWGPSRWGGLVTWFYLGAMTAIVLVIFKLWLPWGALIVGYMVVVLCTCFACHALIYQVRPPAEQVTGYYLVISIGGAMGTAATLLIAPAWFHDYYELQLGLGIAAVALSAYSMHELTPRLGSDAWVRRWKWPMNLVLPCVLIGSLWTQAATPSVETTIDQRRDFYGVVRVIENSKLGYRAMVLGQTIHGVEPLSGELDVDQSMYYGARSGVSLAWGWTRDRLHRPLRVGAIGLGTGTLSLYAARGDQLVYYEISSAVYELASKHFHYLAAHGGETEVRIGDGRTVIASEIARGLGRDEPMDLLLVDAFTNDSLPMHLMTLEAIQTYSQRLTPEGVIAFNITNRNLDLAPILFAAAQASGYQGVLIENPIDTPGPAGSTTMSQRDVRWMLFVPQALEPPAWPGARTRSRNPGRLWTDTYGSVLQAFRP
jgi:spermidine synthase